jgi:predicted ATP-dependent serine protease
MAGDLVILGGNTKIGKTAFVQWIIAQFPDIKTAFMSLEVGEDLIARRFFQCGLALSKDNFTEWNDEYDQYLKEGMSHIHVTCESPDIRDYNKVIETYSPRMLVIDTIDTIPVKYYTDEYERQNFIIKELKSLANKYKIIIFGISHISKSAAFQLENGERLGIHSFKGNSVIEQKADKVIGFENHLEDERIKIISSLGTRDDNPFEIKMSFNHETFSFEQI